MDNKFRYVNEIKFKDRTYAIFDNDGYKVFLRKLDADDFEEPVNLGDSIKSTKLVYTDIDEFKELNKIFNHKLKLINAMLEDAGAEEENFEDNLEITLEKGKLYRFPMRVYNNGEFISLAQAINETGFGIARKKDLGELEAHEEQELFNSEEELFNSKKIEVEETADGEYRIKSIRENPEYKDSTFIKDSEEFSEISGIYKPSYDDLREVVKNNPSLKGKFQDTVLEGIDNLETSGFEADFSVLYYNLSRIEIIEMDFGIISFLNGNQTTVATFNPTDGQIAVVSENWDNLSEEEILKRKYTLLHEILGHGSTEAYVRENIKSISYSVVTPIEDTEGNLVTCDMINFGDAYREAIADIIALRAIGGEKELITYKPYFMELEILLKVLPYNVSDLIDYGVWGLKQKMMEEGIDNPEKYIDRVDTSKMSIATSNAVSEKYDIQSDIIEMLKKIIEHKMANGTSKEDAILDLVNILDNEITLDYEDSFENIILPISIADIKKGIITDLEEKA